jgi:hypothetical protein
MVHERHDETRQIIQVWATARRNTLHHVSFWRLYCSGFKVYKRFLKMGDEGGLAI